MIAFFLLRDRKFRNYSDTQPSIDVLQCPVSTYTASLNLCVVNLFAKKFLTFLTTLQEFNVFEKGFAMLILQMLMIDDKKML